MVKYSVVLYLCSIRYGRYGGVSSLSTMVVHAYMESITMQTHQKRISRSGLCLVPLNEGAPTHELTDMYRRIYLGAYFILIFESIKMLKPFFFLLILSSVTVCNLRSRIFHPENIVTNTQRS